MATAEPNLEWIFIDGSTANTIDSTGADTLRALARDLAGKGIRLGRAGFHTETRSDVTPASPLAQMLAWTEAATGQLYLAILVAGIVGFRVTQATKR